MSKMLFAPAADILSTGVAVARRVSVESGNGPKSENTGAKGSGAPVSSIGVIARSGTQVRSAYRTEEKLWRNS